MGHHMPQVPEEQARESWHALAVYANGRRLHAAACEAELRPHNDETMRRWRQRGFVHRPLHCFQKRLEFLSAGGLHGVGGDILHASSLSRQFGCGAPQGNLDSAEGHDGGSLTKACPTSPVV